MALPVDVSSIDVLRSVREALVIFAEEAQGALGATESEINRCVDWLTHDQRIYWQNEVKRRKEDLSQAKTELHRKQIAQTSGTAAHDTEQREAVRQAKRRMEEAEDKVELLQRWLPEVQRAIMEYQGQARSFADLLEFDVDRSVEGLDRMIDALDEYVRLAVPVTAPIREAPSAASPTPKATAAPPAPVAPTPAAEPPAPDDEPEAPLMHVGSGTAKLRHALKALRAKWDDTEDGWRDRVREDFEQKRIAPLEAQAASTLRAMQTLCDVLSRAYRDCS